MILVTVIIMIILRINFIIAASYRIRSGRPTCHTKHKAAGKLHHGRQKCVYDRTVRTQVGIGAMVETPFLFLEAY